VTCFYCRTTKDFLVELYARRGKVEKLLEATDRETADAVDWVKQAFDKVAPGRYTISRTNGIGEKLPNFCLKVPTGGGKTFLATRVIDLVNTHYRHSQRGLVLWVVPTSQIYKQTLQALKDRDHPYRQQLDIASAGRTLILEKGSGFSPADVEESGGAHLKNEDTDYKRSVFSRCTELATESDWAHLAPEMSRKRMRFEVVAEEEWQSKLNEMLAER
jgi:hypothetical protein